MELPAEIWESVCCKLIHGDDYRVLEPLSLVSTTFLHVTNRLRTTFVITDRTVTYLAPHLLRFRNLKRIRFFEFTKDFHMILNQLAVSGLDKESIAKMKKTLTSVKCLNCSNVLYLSDRDLVSISACFPFLETLDISCPYGGSSRVSDYGIISLSFKLKGLLKINMSGHHLMTDKSLLSLSKNCVLLTEIIFHDCGFISSDCIGLVLRNSKNLESLAIKIKGWEPSQSFDGNAFLVARRLSELDLSESTVSDELLCLIADAKLPLKKLVLCNCKSFTFDGIFYLLNKYQTLLHLNLEGSSFLSDDMVMELGKFLRCLTFLNISFCSKLTGLTFFTIIEKCVSLKCIRMIGTNFGVEEFSKEQDFKSDVKSVYISINPNLRDECLQKLSRHCPFVETLEVARCPLITSDGILHVLRDCGEIRSVNICVCTGIKSLTLDFELPKLESLRASATVINDEALDVISKSCQGLLYLDLEGCSNVRSSGVRKVVKSCKRLREISLKYCTVNAEILRWIVCANPSIRRIVLACDFPINKKLRNFLLLHGCVTCQDPSDSWWQHGLD